MLRELSQLLDELHDGLVNVEARGGVQLSAVDMTLPLDVRAVFRGGTVVLLADVPRTRSTDEWIASPSRLSVSWSSGVEASK